MERAFVDAGAFAAWLEKNHASSTGLWLKLAKKGAGVPSVSYADAVDVALAWGWIDGQKQSLDARFWLQRFCPRRKSSLWSKINCEKATKLIADGKMRPSGLREIERAKADGRWDAAYDSPSRAKVPDELAAALAGNARAARSFSTIDATNRYAILWRVQTAKRPETRARRVAELVAMLARGELLHPPRRKAKPARAPRKTSRRR